MARPICLRLLLHWLRAAASRTFCTAGTSRPIRMAMMAMTTSSSISVKPRERQRLLNRGMNGLLERDNKKKDAWAYPTNPHNQALALGGETAMFPDAKKGPGTPVPDCS